MADFPKLIDQFSVASRFNEAAIAAPVFRRGVTVLDEDLRIEGPDLVLTKGNATLDEGNVTVTAGDLTLTSGDATIGGTLSVGGVELGSWSAWTPSLTNITQGNGTITARYTQIGKLVIARFEFTLGSTSSIGTGGTISLPVTAASSYTAAESYIGRGVNVDGGSVAYPSTARLESTTTMRPLALVSSGTYLGHSGITATVPFTWATTDLMSMSVVYEAA